MQALLCPGVQEVGVQSVRVQGFRFGGCWGLPLGLRVWGV